MKKFLVFFLALAAAGVGFAQIPDGFKIDGAVRTGFQLDVDKDGNADAKPYSLDAGKLARVDLNVGYTQDNFGLNTRFRYNDAFNGGGTVNLEDTLFRAWFSAFDSKLKIDLGHMDYDHPLRTPGYLGGFSGTMVYGPGWGGHDNDNLILIQIKPIEGLTIAANTGLLTTAAAPTATEFFENVTGGVTYAKDAITVTASYVGKTGSSGFQAGFGYKNDTFNIAVDANAFGYGADTLSNGVSPAVTEIALKAQFDVGKVNIFLAAEMAIREGKENVGGASVYDIPVIIVPAVKYTVTDNVALELDALFVIRNDAIDHTNNTVIADSPWYFRDGKAGGRDNGKFGLAITPSVSLKVGSGAQLVFYDEVEIGDNSYVHDNFGVDFRWSF